MAWKNIFSAFKNSLLNILYCEFCSACGRKVFPPQESGICSDCLNRLEYIPLPFCSRCGSPLRGTGSACPECRRNDFAFDAGVSAYRYEGLAKQCVHVLKYRRKPRLARPLGERMAEFAGRFPELRTADIVSCVPLHRAKLKERGFNQARLLAAVIGESLGKKTEFDLLLRKRATTRQSSLDGNERRRNVNNAFSCRSRDRVSGRNILLIDDVFTTGSTLHECARVLKKSGAKKIYFLTFAR